MKTRHLIIIIDNNNIVPPQKYSCPFESRTKEESISLSKTLYEKAFNNKDYQSYYFKDEIK